MASTVYQKRFKFTKRALLELPTSDKRTDYRDTATPHLVLRGGQRKTFHWCRNARGQIYFFFLFSPRRGCRASALAAAIVTELHVEKMI